MLQNCHAEHAEHVLFNAVLDLLCVQLTAFQLSDTRQQEHDTTAACPYTQAL